MLFRTLLDLDHNEIARRELKEAGIAVFEQTGRPKAEVPVMLSGFLVKNHAMVVHFWRSSDTWEAEGHIPPRAQKELARYATQDGFWYRLESPRQLALFVQTLKDKRVVNKRQPKDMQDFHASIK